MTRLWLLLPLLFVAGCSGDSPTGPSSSTPPPAAPSIPACCFERTGTGATVFDTPAHVTRVRLAAKYSGRSDMFSVSFYRADGSLGGYGWALMGTCASCFGGTEFEGTYSIPAGSRAEVMAVPTMAWSVTEVR